MPHISLPEGLPGIRGPMAFRPETAETYARTGRSPAERTDHSFARRTRDDSAFVSRRNDCEFCHAIHRAVAAHHLDGNEDLVIQVKADPQHAAISDKLKALLVIAGKTVEGGKRVTAEDVARARQHGATDLEIHDTVLIAAAFCMFNRYVDGLATWAPDDPDFYRARAALVAEHGYASATLRR